MGNFYKKATGAIKAAIHPYSLLGIVIHSICNKDLKYIYHGSLIRKHNKSAAPLMDINVLNERIKSVTDLAASKSTNKKFFIIKRHSATAGLFAYVQAIMAQLVYALAKGFIPVVDMQNYPNIYLEENELGKENAWEKYFKQPCGYGLDDISDKKQIQSYGAFWQQVLPMFIFSGQEQFNKYLGLWSAIYSNFLILNEKCAEYVENEYRKLIKPGMRVLGVFCRGTDYKRMRPPNHNIQPDVEDVVSKVKDMMPEWGCDYVYVTSEERRIARRFESAFPGRVLTVSQRYYDEIDIDYSKTAIGKIHFDRENDAFLKGLEYLSSVMILSRCTCAIMGAASGSMAALCINGGKYENTYIYNLGVY